MNKITIFTAIAPAKAQAGESEIVAREVPPYSLSRQKRPDRVTTGADASTDDSSARMRPRYLLDL